MVFTVEESSEALEKMYQPGCWYFLENSSEPVQQSFFNKLVEKVKNIVASITKWVTDFYDTHFSKKNS